MELEGVLEKESEEKMAWKQASGAHALVVDARLRTGAVGHLASGEAGCSPLSFRSRKHWGERDNKQGSACNHRDIYI